MNSLMKARGEVKVEEAIEGHTPVTSAETTEMEESALPTEVTISVADLLEMHRKLGFCLRGNQRPAVLSIQNDIVKLLPEGTPIVYKE